MMQGCEFQSSGTMCPSDKADGTAMKVNAMRMAVTI